MNFQTREKSGNSGYASQVEGRTCLKRAVVDKQINCTFQAFPIDEPVHTRKKILKIDQIGNFDLHHKAGITL